jgi:hypothetical protein
MYSKRMPRPPYPYLQAQVIRHRSYGPWSNNTGYHVINEGWSHETVFEQGREPDRDKEQEERVEKERIALEDSTTALDMAWKELRYQIDNNESRLFPTRGQCGREVLIAGIKYVGDRRRVLMQEMLQYRDQRSSGPEAMLEAAWETYEQDFKKYFGVNPRGIFRKRENSWDDVSCDDLEVTLERLADTLRRLKQDYEDFQWLNL